MDISFCSIVEGSFISYVRKESFSLFCERLISFFLTSLESVFCFAFFSCKLFCFKSIHTKIDYVVLCCIFVVLFVNDFVCVLAFKVLLLIFAEALNDKFFLHKVAKEVSVDAFTVVDLEVRVERKLDCTFACTADGCSGLTHCVKALFDISDVFFGCFITCCNSIVIKGIELLDIINSCICNVISPSLSFFAFCRGVILFFRALCVVEAVDVVTVLAFGLLSVVYDLLILHIIHITVFCNTNSVFADSEGGLHTGKSACCLKNTESDAADNGNNKNDTDHTTDNLTCIGMLFASLCIFLSCTGDSLFTFLAIEFSLTFFSFSHLNHPFR